jgi:Skp family chaperone for outer membrane proteins
MNEMRKDVKKIAEKKGFNYVMDTNVLIVGGKDITEDVLSELKKEEVKSPSKEK